MSKKEVVMAKSKQKGLHLHITAVKKGEHAFEKAFQAVPRMILEKKIDRVIVNGKSTFDYLISREGEKHIIGMYVVDNDIAQQFEGKT